PARVTRSRVRARQSYFHIRFTVFSPMASIFPTRTSVLAVDLTSTGAPTSWQRDRDPETESFIMARLAGRAKLLDRAGTDLIVTSAHFTLVGRRRRGN